MQFVTVSEPFPMIVFSQPRERLVPRLRSLFLPRCFALQPAADLVVLAPALDSRAIRESGL